MYVKATMLTRGHLLTKHFSLYCQIVMHKELGVAMNEYVNTAVDAAMQAGALLRSGLSRPQTVREATQHDIKLQIDVDCETLIRSIILERFPDHALLGEEGGGLIETERPLWNIDPLDGTVNYAHGLPHFCISIALQIAGETVLGVIYDPVVNELFAAERGHGATLNGRPISVSATRQLHQAVLALGFAKSVHTMEVMLREMHGLLPSIHKARILGAAALDLAYVAAGRIDGFIEYGLQIWDIAAGALLVREAGGRVQMAITPQQCWDVRADNGLLL